MKITWNEIRNSSPGGLKEIISAPGHLQCLELPSALSSFFGSETPGEDGFPRNGLLVEEGVRCGSGACSLFDVTAERSSEALLLLPETEACQWTLIRKEGNLSAELGPGTWRMIPYRGNEPDWSRQAFPFHGLPETTEKLHHAYIRGLLDFLGGTRRSPACGVIYQTPNTSIGKGYTGDGIPDTFFQFCSAYRFLSGERQACFRSQIAWLGDHMRADGCIPWGGCGSGVPYYHLWKREDCGMFFDANGLWLEMIRQLRHSDGIMPPVETIIRAADFYVHYMTEEGLVAAESKKKGCEWADFLQNGWHSSLVNVIAFRGLLAASELMELSGINELAERYFRTAKRLKKSFNLPVEKGGFFTGKGFIDWRDPDGTVHPYWRIDTHMLAFLWDVIEDDKKDIVMQTFREAYFQDEPAVPAPYLLCGAWSSEERDDMLEGCRTFGCGRASMPGRMGGTLCAALRKYGDHASADHILERLTDLVVRSPILWEYYDRDGNGYGAHSYIEHALSPLWSLALSEMHLDGKDQI